MPPVSSTRIIVLIVCGRKGIPPTAAAYEDSLFSIVLSRAATSALPSAVSDFGLLMILRLPTLHHAVLTTAVVFLTISTSSWAKTPSEFAPPAVLKGVLVLD